MEINHILAFQTVFSKDISKFYPVFLPGIFQGVLPYLCILVHSVWHFGYSGSTEFLGLKKRHLNVVSSAAVAKLKPSLA